jgi:hypothetical protein
MSRLRFAGAGHWHFRFPLCGICVEHNRPASFDHPLWSWLADQKMVALVLTGRMNQEVRRFKVSEGPATSR